MTELDYLSATILGVIQAITEFLPVSSSGHLAITQRLMDFDAGSPSMLLFDIAVHVGTLAAVLLFFRSQLWRFGRRLLSESSRSWRRPRVAWRIALLGVCATVPTGIIGLSFKDTFQAAFEKPIWIAVGLFLSGTLLLITRLVPRGRVGWKRFGWGGAVLVGIGQGLAILPGLSRSGTTICVASFLGLRRQWAVEFSFLLAAPAILGAAIIQLKDTAELSPDQLAGVPWGPILLGTLVSTVVGVVALRFLVAIVRRAKLHYFTVYCWAVGLTIAVTMS